MKTILIALAMLLFLGSLQASKQAASKTPVPKAPQVLAFKNSIK